MYSHRVSIYYRKYLLSYTLLKLGKSTKRSREVFRLKFSMSQKKTLLFFQASYFQGDRVIITIRKYKINCKTPYRNTICLHTPFKE